MKTLGLDKKYSRAFDLVMIHDHTSNEPTIDIEKPENITLIELKTTKKKLPKNPSGFFFGATENEFELARKLGGNYKFCFVCLHPESKSFALLTLAELGKIIKYQRTQYQIDLA